MRSPSLLASATLALLLAGCSLIPAYERPDAPIAQSWPSGPAYRPLLAMAPGEPVLAELGWRDFFRSPAMEALIERALLHNRDLRVAALNVERARALYRISSSERLPTLEAEGSFTRQRSARDFTTSGRAETANTYGANLGMTAFELDFFGRVRSLEEEALQSYFATEEARRAAQIALIAEVANAHLLLLADLKLLALTEATLEAQQESYELTASRFEEGLAAQLDVAQARTAVETARANQALYSRLVAQDRNALELLVGEPLAPGFERQTARLDPADFVTDVPPGLPSEVLQQRPDVRGAEHDLLAANANIGAARAAFWPRISLTATGGLASGALDRLFQSGSGTWLFSPSIDLPIFDAGRREADFERAQVDRDIALARYEQTVQTAFREVADALAGLGTFDEQIAAQSSLVEAAQQSYDLAVLRFEQGLDSYLATLDSQRALYGAQQTLITLEQQRLANFVALYRALGGGLRERGEVVAASAWTTVPQ